MPRKKKRPTIKREDPEYCTMQCGNCSNAEFTLKGKTLDDGIFPKMILECTNCGTQVKGMFDSNEN